MSLFIKNRLAYSQNSPDKDTLTVMAFPDAAVAFIGHSKDVWRKLPQVVLGVQVHPLWVIQTWDLLVRVDGCQDAADISLRTEKKRHVRSCFSVTFGHFVSLKF